MANSLPGRKPGDEFLQALLDARVRPICQAGKPRTVAKDRISVERAESENASGHQLGREIMTLERETQ